MIILNPFSDLDTALNYESWYHTAGRKAVIQEKSLIETLLTHFSAAETVLEVGCGTGYFTNWFESIGLQPIGLDFSMSMLKAAQINHQLPCIQGDALALPFPDKTFDLTTFITTLAFITDPAKALTEALRVSKQGLILGVINRHSLLGWCYSLRGGPIWDSARFLTINELIRTLSEILPQKHQIAWKSTLLPLIRGSTKLPWGGFIGLAVKF
jgi:ubiquinone/menaquinone biosynthesis C-methylase UbiE